MVERARWLVIGPRASLLGMPAFRHSAGITPSLMYWGAIPSDVGEAIADHLRRGGPRGSCRRLFLCSCAPLRGISRGAVTSVVYRACERAGAPLVGAHRLRHTVATELLRRGVSLPEIGQVLRHKSLLTTAIYARVDQVNLSTLALPWPGVEA